MFLAADSKFRLSWIQKGRKSTRIAAFSNSSLDKVPLPSLSASMKTYWGMMMTGLKGFSSGAATPLFEVHTPNNEWLRSYWMLLTYRWSLEHVWTVSCVLKLLTNNFKKEKSTTLMNSIWEVGAWIHSILNLAIQQKYDKLSQPAEATCRSLHILPGSHSFEKKNKILQTWNSFQFWVGPGSKKRKKEKRPSLSSRCPWSEQRRPGAKKGRWMPIEFKMRPVFWLAASYPKIWFYHILSSFLSSFLVDSILLLEWFCHCSNDVTFVRWVVLHPLRYSRRSPLWHSSHLAKR